MMNPRIKMALLLVAILAATWLVYTKIIHRMYLAPRRELLQQIKAAEVTLARFSEHQSDRSKLNRQLQAYVDRTLGASLETVDHQFRTQLDRLANGLKLEHQVGTTSAARTRESPAKSRFTGTASRALRMEPDFFELDGWISGSGTYESALSLLDRITSTPWLKRIDHLRLVPHENGSRVDVHIRLTTLFIPNAAPIANDQPHTIETSDALATLLQRNPFRVPAAPAPPRPPVTETAPAFAYGDWLVTGLARSRAGNEVWLRNIQTQETRRLVAGDQLHELVLLDANDDRAEFQHHNQRFSVMIGQNLADRSPLNQ